MSFETRLISSKDESSFNLLGPLGSFKASSLPGIVIPMHSHADPEVMFVVDGALEFLQHKERIRYWSCGNFK